MKITEKNMIRGNQFSLFKLGFRIFFLSAGLTAIFSMALWGAIYHQYSSIVFTAVSSMQWHAHEMIYGYSIAVIAGFLLTAVKNWTGQNTLVGKSLMALFSLWLTARITILLGSDYFLWAAFFDSAFLVLLLVSVAYPIIKVKQWNHLIVLFIILMLLTFNVIFYLGGLDKFTQGVEIGLYGGLYIVVMLIQVMGRRVIPFFIERGVGYEVTLFNSVWLDRMIILLLMGFVVSTLFTELNLVSASLAFALFISNAIRLIGWHTKGIWNKSMLWSIYLACWFIALGFLLIALSYAGGVSKYLGIHAIAVGGISLITMGMMSRVALGHTGRDVSKPSRLISIALAIVVMASLVRVFFPLLAPNSYALWVGLSQVLWIIAFSFFIYIYAPILMKPRIDNQPG